MKVWVLVFFALLPLVSASTTFFEDPTQAIITSSTPSVPGVGGSGAPTYNHTTLATSIPSAEQVSNYVIPAELTPITNFFVPSGILTGTQFMFCGGLVVLAVILLILMKGARR
jgi:hypothetical protein